jgi:hypothetical protein
MKKEIEKETEKKPYSRLAMLGMTLVVLSIIFSVNDRLISYCLMGAGVILSVIDIIIDLKYKEA